MSAGMAIVSRDDIVSRYFTMISGYFISLSLLLVASRCFSLFYRIYFFSFLLLPRTRVPIKYNCSLWDEKLLESNSSAPPRSSTTFILTIAGEKLLPFRENEGKFHIHRLCDKN